MSEWFRRWFGEEFLALYEELYPRRNEAEAEQLVALLTARGIARAGDLVLDLACGTGRHASVLARHGARVVGLDLSMPQLRRAQARGVGPLVRGDIRALALAGGRFDAALNLFTSFGYFEDDGEHERVLREVARILRAGAWFVLDFLNAPHVRGTLVARDERTAHGRTVVQERWLSEDGRFVHKRITVGGEDVEFEERVRLFDREDLEQMLGRTALEPCEVLGDYLGGPHAPDSPRLILMAKRR